MVHDHQVFSVYFCRAVQRAQAGLGAADCRFGVLPGLAEETLRMLSATAHLQIVAKAFLIKVTQNR